jgi:ABC-type lipoprotein export system ATPase subunit
MVKPIFPHRSGPHAIAEWVIAAARDCRQSQVHLTSIVQKAGGIYKAPTAFGSSGRKHHKPVHLSGDRWLRVAAIRTIVSEPQILPADRPAGSLNTV